MLQESLRRRLQLGVLPIDIPAVESTDVDTLADGTPACIEIATETHTYPCPDWQHRHLVGSRGRNVKKILSGLKDTKINFVTNENVAVVTGPSHEASIASNALWSEMIKLNEHIKYVEMNVDSTLHGQIIGSNGSIYKRIVKDTGCSIIIDSRANKITIEGSSKATEEAVREIESILHKKMNQKRTRTTKIMVIPKKQHDFLIGREGATLRCMLHDIKEVSVSFPDKDVESDIVTIHGARESVERVVKKLKDMVNIC